MRPVVLSLLSEMARIECVSGDWFGLPAQVANPPIRASRLVRGFGLHKLALLQDEAHAAPALGIFPLVAANLIKQV